MNPKKAGKEPVAVRVINEDEYWWCACGHSKNQPYCDGSHRHTEMGPRPFSPERSGEVWLCMCKHTKNPPYCDGTHNKLDK
jgi:CDGSH-type Zn-finger protein